MKFESRLQTESEMLQSASSETEARAIIQGHSTWSLKNMVSALSVLEVLNTPEENMRLRLAKQELKSRKVGG